MTEHEAGGAAALTRSRESLQVRPQSEAEVAEAVRSAPGRVLPRGGGTKPALSTPPERPDEPPVTVVESGALTGITEYNPSEFTFTARAGTPLAEIAQALAEHGQAMAFDPPLVDAGATLGGAIAAGLSGPGRVRFGGLRDFLLGVTFVDGKGDVVHGGGRVVKNAAGLDFARMLVGSAGRLGILTEATFKVFPSPPAYGTVRIPVESMLAGAALLARLNALPLEYYGVELAADEPALYARLGGLEQVLPARLAQIVGAVGGEQLAATDEAAFWRDARELAWAQSDGLLLRIATLPHRVAAWEALPLVQQAQRRYSAGGHILWARFSAGSAVADIERLLVSEGTGAVAVRGAAPHPILGKRTGLPFLGALRTVFDPTNRFFQL